MAKKQALGKGLSALLPDKSHFEDVDANEQVVQLSIGRIEADPEQFRQFFDEEKLSELAESIREYGVMQPLLVAQTDVGDYKIIAGERRYRAAAIVGLTELPCIVRYYNDNQLAEVSLIENIQREDLGSVEEATAYKQLMERFAYTQEALAAKLGKSRSHIANTLRLLQLPPQYQKLVESGQLSAGHARAILSLDNDKDKAKLVDAILKQGFSVRQAESLAKTIGETKKEEPAREKIVHSAHMKDLQKKLTSRLGLPTQLVGGLDKGKIVVAYNNTDDLENLLEKILGKNI